MLFCVYFSVIIVWFCKSGLILSFWSDLLTVGWRLILLFLAYLVSQGCLRHSEMTICHSGLNFSFWDKFVILGWICHFALNLSFHLGWLCHSLLNLSLGSEFLFWACVTLGYVYHSGLTLSFWAEFIVLGWLCHVGLNLTRLFIFGWIPVLNHSSWAKIVDLGCIWNFCVNFVLSFWKEILSHLFLID